MPLLQEIFGIKDSSDFLTCRQLPVVLAEAGVNHEGSMETAIRLIEEASEGGADAIKFQTYRAQSIASKHSPAYWDTEKEPTQSQFRLFQKYDKFWKTEFEKLKEHCDVVGIEFLSTPFDLESADFLNDLMEVFKISSSDITNKPFIEYICQFGKPIILSTGASNIDEIDNALSWIDSKGVQVAVLHCVLNYPTQDKNANLSMITGLKKKYPGRIVGYSDHTTPDDMRALETAWLLGAQILEKHFTHDKTLPGNDHYHAMDKADLITFRKNLAELKVLLGVEQKHALECEDLARQHARRSLVAVQIIAAGTQITSEMLTWKRPAHGISPAEIDQVLGRKTVCDIHEDDLLSWDMLEKSR
jgi:N-acetylneuraminate synthase